MSDDSLKKDATCTANDSLSRRDFLALAGMTTTAAIALDGHTLAQDAPAAGDGSLPLRFDSAQLADTHDLPSLPAWGPYSKKYFGISHIPDVRRGLSFDLCLFPSLTEGAAKLPSVTEPSGVHPWDVAPDLDFYSYRLETVWKDRLYCDLAFCRLDGNSRLIRMELVNETDHAQEIVLNCLGQLCFPPLRELTAEPIRPCDIELPPGAMWVHALDYADFTYAKPRPTDTLVPDGRWRGEMRHHDCVGSSAIDDRFGRDAGDSVRYRVRLAHSFAQAMLVWRFFANRGESVKFAMKDILPREITFEGTGEFTTVSVPLGPIAAGSHELSFVSQGGAAVVLNGFVVAEADQSDSIRFPEKRWDPTPEIERIGTSCLLLKYKDVPNCYGISLNAAWTLVRQLKWRELDDTFHNQSSTFTHQRIFGDGRSRAGDPDGIFVHAASEPLTLAPHDKKTLYGLVCTGTEADVRKRIESFDPHSATNERSFRLARAKRFQFACSPCGEPFQFSQQRMAAVTLTNLVYPLYTQRNYIRHYSPGKIWDCLYTWDAGFVGLGLLELDPEKALESLNAYTTPEGAQSAFIHHGTPIPTQIYLYRELWNRTQSKEMLEYLYPRLRQFHRFLAGRLGSSTTRRHQDHLLATWDYFYNSGGWDDYPPQKFMHQEKLTESVTPVVNSSHAIRCARLLRRTAVELGRTEDCAEYDRDIDELSRSLQQYSWDQASGYFGYVTHDAAGKPTGILRTAEGVNFDMGLDGVMPLIAGICTAEQERHILGNLFSEKHLWTEVGITTVDQSAPYYRADGYWNGSVWFAHQWFLWKTMLDLGRGDLAVRIAKAGLGVWKRVADATYDCVEHFTSRAPYGAGWVQFSSLSSPALSWFAALYTPGRFTYGFDMWIRTCEFRDHYRQLEVKLEADGVDHERSVLACMHPASTYCVLWNGVPIPHSVILDGLLQIQIPSRAGIGKLSIQPL